MKAEEAKPQKCAADGDSGQEPPKNDTHCGEIQFNGWGKQKDDVKRIGKSLLIARLSGAGGIEEFAVKGDLDFVRDFDSVRITMVEEKFAGHHTIANRGRRELLP